MKKIILVLTFLLLFPITCLAKDIYVGVFDDFTIYLRDESVDVTYTVNKGSRYNNLLANYTLIMIPTPDLLGKLKRQCLDDRIEYRKSTFELRINYDRVDQEWGDAFIDETSEVLCGDGKVLFRNESLLTNIPCYGDSAVAVSNRKIINEIINLTKEKPEIFKHETK